MDGRLSFLLLSLLQKKLVCYNIVVAAGLSCEESARNALGGFRQAMCGCLLTEPRSRGSLSRSPYNTEH